MSFVKDHVLVVEDEPLIAYEITEALSAAGFAITLASRAEQALAMLHTMTPLAAIVDLNLDGTRADNVLEDLQQRRIPFMIYSGYEPTGLPALHVKKPCSAERLVEHLSSLLVGPTSAVA